MKNWLKTRQVLFLQYACVMTVSQRGWFTAVKTARSASKYLHPRPKMYTAVLKWQVCLQSGFELWLLFEAPNCIARKVIAMTMRSSIARRWVRPSRSSGSTGLLVKGRGNVLSHSLVNGAIFDVLNDEGHLHFHPCPPNDTLMRWCKVVEAPSMRISGKISVCPTGVDR